MRLVKDKQWAYTSNSKKNKRRERRFSCLRVRYSCVNVSREARLLGTEHPSNFFVSLAKLDGGQDDLSSHPPVTATHIKRSEEENLLPKIEKLV